ncbi:hypothetical protein RZE82_05305 [Mollicutes bacterium LVI A0039]|nr:hypothetical protein RZE82_05305 [Mollicutes bacterium LVI A0039]
MKKTILAIMLILIGYLAFFSGTIIAQRSNITPFDEDVIILDVPFANYQSNIEYEHLKGQYLIYNGLNPDIRYDRLATENNYIDITIKAGASDVRIYDGATKEKALASEPIFTCYAQNECRTTIDLSQTFYVIEADENADLRLIYISEIEVNE